MSFIKDTWLSFITSCYFSFCRYNALSMEYKKDNLNQDPQAPFASGNVSADERAIFYQTLGKKTEKVATAIYMVSSHIDDRESIKGSFRDIALALVLETLSLEDPIRPAEEIFLSMNVATGKLQSLITLAASLGMISTSNARILDSELGSVCELALSGRKHYALTTLDDVLKTIYPEELPTRIDKPLIGQNMIAPQVTLETKKPTFITSALPAKNPSISSGQAKQKASAEVATPSLSKRKDQILKLIRDKGEVSIKDISKDFADCSEKTIQRDINALVEEGKVRKEGNRRWSRYSLKK